MDSSRHGLFRYLTAGEAADYLAIMDLFSATLLTDLSAAEVATQLAERGLAIARDVVEARCGNWSRGAMWCRLFATRK